MEADPSPQQKIFAALNHKARIKVQVNEVALDIFNQLKDVLGEMSNDLNDLLEEENERKVRLEYRDRGKYEAELKFADDVLVFSLHTDVFQFDRDHAVWKNPYVKANPFNSYCGVINVYNFLSDSLKFNRGEDVGYLVARLFVNRDKYFFVEGKRQLRQKTSNFGKVMLVKEELVSFVEQAMLYSLEFDLLVPPYDLVKMATVEQINTKIESTRMRTGKRLGYKYNSDDVLSE